MSLKTFATSAKNIHLFRQRHNTAAITLLKHRVLPFIQISCQECLSRNNRPIDNMANRIIMLFVGVMLFFAGAQAQQVTQGSIRALSDVRAVSVEYDFSNAKVEDLPLYDYIQFMGMTEDKEYLDDFEKEIKEIIADFIEEFNDTNSPILLAVSENPTVSMTIWPKQISRNGNTINCDYIFKDKSTNKVLANITSTTKNGRIGSFTNLMGDAFEKAGKKLGKYLKKNLKRK